jgi:hypothetical protein
MRVPVRSSITCASSPESNTTVLNQRRSPR